VLAITLILYLASKIAFLLVFQRIPEIQIVEIVQIFLKLQAKMQIKVLTISHCLHQIRLTISLEYEIMRSFLIWEIFESKFWNFIKRQKRLKGKTNIRAGMFRLLWKKHFWGLGLDYVEI